MTSSKPYLIRALYEWIADNNLTPHVLVNADISDCIVPKQFVKNGKIILNISALAANQLRIGNDAIEFNAKFNGKPFHINVPIVGVLAIYAQENGHGMSFPQDEFKQHNTNKTTSPDTTEQKTATIVPFKEISR